MAIIKCKMCGGDIVLSEDRTFGTCEYCGSTMTFPKVSDEQRLNLFNRANHFRRLNEFDKAIAAYDKILDQDDDLQQAVTEGDVDGAKALCPKVMGSLAERNRICSVNK